MLWVGWFGFNGGSAAAAGAIASFANLVTHLSASAAGITWMLLDLKDTGKTSIIGLCTGAVAGLASITPAAGSVGPLGAVIIGTVAAFVCRFMSVNFKEKAGYDDSLDCFGVHGVGGILGTLLLAPLGTAVFGGFNAGPWLPQFFLQLKACLGVGAWAAAASWVCLKVTKMVCGGSLRVPEEAETGEGLDIYSHGESGKTLCETDPPIPVVPIMKAS
jgi:ammonia channel protein AmtB